VQQVRELDTVVFARMDFFVTRLAHRDLLPVESAHYGFEASRRFAVCLSDVADVVHNHSIRLAAD